MEETPEKTRSHPLKTAKTLLLGAVLCIVLGCACFIGGRLSAGSGSETPRLDAVVLETQIRDISELASVTYTYTNMAQFESSNDFYGVKIPFTTKSFILTYDGTIKAGVDLSQATVDVEGSTVRITLPQAAILSHEIDPDSLEVFDETRSIFNPITIEDYNGFQADQQGVMEEKALQAGLLTQAQDQAEAAVTGLLTPLLDEGQALEVRTAEAET